MPGDDHQGNEAGVNDWQNSRTGRQANPPGIRFMRVQELSRECASRALS